MTLFVDESSPLLSRDYTVVIDKTGLPHERKLKLIWEESKEVSNLRGIESRLRKLAEETRGIREIELIGEGDILRIRLTGGPYWDVDVLGNFLRAVKEEFSLQKISVKCGKCASIEKRANS